jgi:short-subunit dehydrogenase/uncharacterized protein (DUF2062 family)
MIRKKLLGLKGNPRTISTGYALGIFLGTTPFVGCKVFIALLLTSLFKWSKISAVFGVYHINLFTAPFFYALSYIVGNSVTGGNMHFVFPEQASASEVFRTFYGNAPVFYSLLVGGLILGIPLAMGAYFFAMAVTGRNRTTNDPDPLNSSAAGSPLSIVHPEPTSVPYTLITGASSGLGKEFAIDCAKRGMNLILVALPGRNLRLLCNTLERQYTIRAVAYEADLTRHEEVITMADHILGRYPVNFLINNAGTGGTIEFGNSSIDYLERIIHLNITAMALLTRLFIPELRKHQRAYILNVSSMAAFSPIPYKTIYPASKAFIYNFSRSLNQELKGTGVSVAVIHPGPILTNPDVAVRIVRQGSAGKIGLLQAKEIARCGVDGVMAGRDVIIPGFMNKVNRFLMTVVPSSFRLGTLSKVIHREIEQDSKQAA